MADKANPRWLDRYDVSDPDDVHHLEILAALKEFRERLPRHKAEEEAHKHYRQEQLEDSAAHHLVGIKAAHAAGDMDSAKRHALHYALALKGLGHDGVDPPDNVAEKAKHSTDGVYKYRSHKADHFADAPKQSGSSGD